MWLEVSQIPCLSKEVWKQTRVSETDPRGITYLSCPKTTSIPIALERHSKAHRTIQSWQQTNQSGSKEGRRDSYSYWWRKRKNTGSGCNVWIDQWYWGRRTAFVVQQTLYLQDWCQDHVEGFGRRSHSIQRTYIHSLFVQWCSWGEFLETLFLHTILIFFFAIFFFL